MPFAVLEKQFELLTDEHQKSVYNYVSFLLSEQKNVQKETSVEVSEKLFLLDSLVGIIPSDIDLDAERVERISKSI